MNAFDYSDLLLPLSLGVANLVVAGVLHRSIVRNPMLLRRRHFLESLAVLGFLIALILVVAGFALWRENPRFVLVCTGGWVLSCLIAAAFLRHRNQRGDDDLAPPEMWPTSSLRSSEPDVTAADPRQPASRRSPDETRGRATPLDAFTRARLKKARRERSTGDDRLRKNRSVYADDKAVKRDRPDREGR